MVGLNVFDTAVKSGIFQTFTQLLQGSDLEKKLRGKEFYTLFAPIDISFAYLPPTTLNRLLRAENLGVLSHVLSYHAIAKKIMSSELRKMSKAQTVCGMEIAITNDAEIKVDGASVLHFDIVACNGVIHGIDRLLMPSEIAVAASVRSH